MTARAQAYYNRVLDALLANLDAIGKTSDATDWLTAPKVVRRGIAVDAQALPKPGIFIMSRGWGPNDRLPSANGISRGRVEAEFDVLCIVDFPVTAREAEQEINNLCADVIVAIERDCQLGDLMPSGYLKVKGYRPDVELSGAAFSTAVVEVYATWLWDTDNP